MDTLCVINKPAHHCDEVLANVGHEGIERPDKASVVWQDILAIPVHGTESLRVVRQLR